MQIGKWPHFGILGSGPRKAGFVFNCPKKTINGKKSPGKFCHRIFNPGIKWSQKSWNFLPSKEKILEFSRIFFLEFHENLVFPEFSGPRIFHPAIFCLEIFCPGILFPGKFWHSAFLFNNNS